MPKDPDAGLSLIRIYDQLENYIGKELYFVIENGNETGFSFINVDDFRTSMTEKEVIALQNETMAALITMEDPYKEYIVSSYKEEEIIPFGRTICFDLNGQSNQATGWDKYESSKSYIAGLGRNTKYQCN